MKPFTEFSFNGVNCADYHLVRVSDGSRYQDAIAITLKDTTATVAGSDGTIFLNSNHQQRTFAISVAFDSVTEEDLRNMRQWLNGKNIGELIFGEEPDRVFDAKVSGSPQLKYICFDEPDPDDKTKKRRIYKGEGTINFVAYYPYAHSAKKYYLPPSEDASLVNTIDGSIDSPFVYEYSGPELPAHSTLSFSYILNNKSTTVSITLTAAASHVEWNSRTGMVVSIDSNKKRTPINYIGNSMISLPVGATFETQPANTTISFYHWYY